MSEQLPSLPARRADGHKGTFGTVCVVGGQVAPPRVMVGGPALAAVGALRAGAGLAVLAVPAPIMRAALTIAPSATGVALPVDDRGALRPSEVAAVLDRHRPGVHCLAVGPGLGDEPPQQQVVVRLAGQDDLPVVLDADALNALAVMPDFARDLRAPLVLTPHPGEFRRLAAALALEADPVDSERRPDAAAHLARRLGCVVVLKGPRTVISDGLQTHVNETGNVALATAGTGDVLTGVIAGLVAQFHRETDASGTRRGPLSLLDCARLGVHLHGRAADLWASRHGTAGLLAADLLAELPAALVELRARA